MKKLPNLGSLKPTYTLVMPTTGETVSYQPYTREQEKAILIAAQDENYQTLISSLENLVNSCCSSCPTTVVDFVFVLAHIKAKSHGESHDFVVNECECGHKNIKVHVDNIIENLKIKNPDVKKQSCSLSDDISVRLCPTNVDSLKQMKFTESTDATVIADTAISQVDSMIANSIEYVKWGTDVIKDFTTDEIVESIVKHLTSKQIEDLNKKIGSMISVVFECEYVCSKCKKTFKKEISDFLF